MLFVFLIARDSSTSLRVGMTERVMEKFDVVIIGSGPGGYIAAIRAGQLGLKTAIVEKDKELGGTCLNVGCIPSKALLTSSDHFMFVKKEAAKHGIVIDGARVDLAKMQERKDKVVKTFNSGVRSLMKTNKVTVLRRRGHNHRARKSFDQILQWRDTGDRNEKYRHRHRQRAGGTAVREI